jgi:hypothetical protein
LNMILQLCFVNLGIIHPIGMRPAFNLLDPFFTKSNVYQEDGLLWCVVAVAVAVAVAIDHLSTSINFYLTLQVT